MNILLVHRHFWPDVPTYPLLLRLLGRHLRAEGHAVTVLSTQPSYNGAYRGPRPPGREWLDGVDVHRLALLPERGRARAARVLNAGLFVLTVTAHILVRGGRYDVVVVSTLPPVAMGAAVRVVTGMRGLGYVYHCLDIHPEAAVQGGLLPDGVRLRALRGIDRRTCDRARAVVVLSEDMRRTLLARGGAADNIHVINNPVAHEADDPRPAEETGEPVPPGPCPDGADPLVVLFAGNLGRFQGLEHVVDAAGTLAHRADIRFVFLGAGRAREDLERRAGALVGRTVIFLDHRPVAEASRLMRRADLGIVSLRPGVIHVAFPSKTMQYLQAGCRVLAVVEPDSELARFVRRERVGRTVAPGDPAGIARAVLAEA
ncbi:MAG: glycosyltransferase family 4 protein, partial [Actinomycetota bacterium]|nr:glycosyltransferase family 4 protein [Actinomycetota bacterium]